MITINVVVLTVLPFLSKLDTSSTIVHRHPIREANFLPTRGTASRVVTTR